MSVRESNGGISEAIRLRCGYHFETSGVGISERLFGIASHSIKPGSLILWEPHNERIVKLSARLPNIVVLPEHEESVYCVGSPDTPSLSNSSLDASDLFL